MIATTDANRVAQTVGVTTTYYALDTAIGLPEVVYTSEGNAYLHLPGVIVAESNSGDTRYLLSDGLGSVRHAVDDSGAVVSYKEFDPYGNPIVNYPLSTIHSPYGYTGEWWEDEVGLLYLRARWYQPETGTFLSRDAVENEPPYQYVRGNVVNLTDPSGFTPNSSPFYSYSCNCGWIDWRHAGPHQGSLVYRAVETIQNKESKYSTFFLGPEFGAGGEIIDGLYGRLGIDGMILINSNLTRQEQLAVALGIFISVQNLVEAGQAGQAGTSSFYPGGGPASIVAAQNPASSFSEEDLMSNLIGFYMGLHQEGDSLGMSRQEIEQKCDVLDRGGSSTRRAEINEQILEEYDSFKQVKDWGRPRLDGWNGFIEERGCPTLACKQPRRIPAEFLRITPTAPTQIPVGEQITGQWTWMLAQAYLYFEGTDGNSLLSNLPSMQFDNYIKDLNIRPLNWNP